MPEYYRPTLINVAGQEPLAWRTTFTAGDNIILSQSMTARTIMISATLATGGGGTSVTLTADNSFPDNPLIAMSRLSRTNAAHTTINTVAEFTYVGLWPAGIVFKFVEAQLINTGAANSPCEIGLFSSSSAPNKAAQTLTSIVVSTQPTGMVNAGAIVRNFDPFTTTLATSTYLWCGIRVANAGGQADFAGLWGDHNQCHVLKTHPSPALTATTSFLTTLTGTGEPRGIDLRATMV